MNKTGKEDNTRLNKLDSFFLWVGSLSGVGFSILIAYFRLSWVPYVPIFILIGYAIGVGYLRGAVFSESFTERIRGWNYLLLGLSCYIPLIIFKFGSSFIEPYFPDYPNLAPSLTPIVVMLVVITYVVVSNKTSPAVYKSFDMSYGDVTKKIIYRTFVVSLFLGFALYNLALTFSQTKIDTSLLVYLIIILFLIIPLAAQEKRIQKLLPLERYQSYVEIETIEKNKLKNAFLIVLSFVNLSLLIILQFPSGGIQQILVLVFSIVFIVSIMGYFISLLLSDRGDMIKAKDTAANELPEQELTKFRELVTKANS
jgi:hypothetical protein